MHTDQLIIPYSEAIEARINNVGGKAYSLANCISEGFQVPNGVIISVNAFQAYLQGKDMQSVYIALSNYLGEASKLIVRSSAIEEDKSDSSFAGQFLSLATANDPKSIQTAVETCWESYDAAGVEAYRKSILKGKHNNGTGIALLVQELVNASCSGVCFSVDPVTNQKDKVIINCVHGLGETLMSGETIADQYEFNTNDGIITRSVYGKQKHWRSSNDPGKLMALPQRLLSKPVLTDNQICQLAQLTKSAEKLFKKSIDMEWAFDGHTFYILQVRPITALDKGKDYTLWTRDNVADVIPDAVTPLTWSIVDDATNKGFQNALKAIGIPYQSADLFKIFDGRVYFNQSAYQGFLKSVSLSKKNLPVFVKVLGKYFYLVHSINKKVNHLKKFLDNELPSSSGHPHAQGMIELKKNLNMAMTIHFQIAILMEIGLLVIRKLAEKYVEENKLNTLVDELFTGLAKIESTEVANVLWELGSLIKNNHELTTIIKKADEKSIPNILTNYGGIFSEKWADLLKDYGHMSMKEFEIYYPRWAEEPSYFAASLKQYVLKKNELKPEQGQKTRIKKQHQAKRALLGKTPFIHHLLLRFYIKHVQKCSIWRESIKQRLVKIMGEIRRHALDFAQENEIIPVENVFFLSMDELIELKKCKSPNKIYDQIDDRKNSWKKFDREKAFKEIRITADDREIKIPYLEQSGQHLNGLPLSSGKYIGKAKIISDLKNLNSFKSGDILVTHSTNPSWTPLFTLAGAIVTDMGNYLSHGAIIARELGIPAVGNLYNATLQIKDGQTIYVNGDTGIVTIQS